jgi:prephenate dehydrogenase
MKALFEEMAPLLPVHALVMDTGSTKAQVLRWAADLLPTGVRFVGGHPMAGKTETGPDAAEAKLFQGAVWCLAPLPTTQRDAIDEAVRLVESLGASSYFLDPDEHDGLVASVSHLPYLMSVALVGHLGRERSWRETASLAAGGFAYATHLSDSDPQMFADIMRTNRDNVARRLDLYIDELSSLRDAIASDSLELKDRFSRAQALHQDWLAGRAQGQTSDGENPLPTTRSMLTGSLFGRFGRDRDKEKEK